MKKITLLVVAFVFAMATNAQVNISFEQSEGYDIGPINGQNEWQSDIDFIQVSDAMASDGDQSMEIGLDENGDIPADQISIFQKPLATAVSGGQKEVSVHVYVPSDFGPDSESSQIHIIPGALSEQGVQPYSQLVLIQGIVGVVQQGSLASTGLTLNPGEWNKVSVYMNFDDSTYEIGLNGDLASDESGAPIDIPAPLDQVDVLAMATDGTVQFYADDIYVGESTMGVEDFTVSNFTHYTKNNTLYLTGDSQIGEVAVYNMLGQQVASQSVNATSGELNLSNLSAGVYIAKVATKGQSKSFKFVKK